MSRSIVRAVNSAGYSESVFVGNCSPSSSAVLSGKALSFSTVPDASISVGIIDSFFVGNCSAAVETFKLVSFGDSSPTLEPSESVVAGECDAMGAIIDSVSAGGLEMLGVAVVSVLIDSAPTDWLTIDSVLTGCLFSETESVLFGDFSGV